MIDFPSPILSLASDVISELDGEDAVLGLWTRTSPLFSSLFSPIDSSPPRLAQSSQSASSLSRTAGVSRISPGDYGTGRCPIRILPRTLRDQYHLRFLILRATPRLLPFRKTGPAVIMVSPITSSPLIPRF